MSQAFQCQAYPSHACGPVLVPSSAMAANLPVIVSSNSSSTSTTRDSVACYSKSSSPTASMSCFSEEAELELMESMGATTPGAPATKATRAQAVAQRMERKKRREKMRRQEVNDKFNELREALAEVDGPGQATVQQQLPEQDNDKGNFRVDVLSRAVRVIKRLNEDVHAQHGEVERLRAQLEQTSVSSSSSSSAAPPAVPAVKAEAPAAVEKPSCGKLPGPPMTWVTVPMWMPSGPTNGHADHQAAMAQAKGMMLGPSSFGGMPFFVPPSGGMLMPTPASHASEVAADADFEAPTHAPCA